MVDIDTNGTQKNLSKAFFTLWLLALIILSVFIRVHGVEAFYYSADEMMHVEMAQGRNASEVWQFSLSAAHPPLGNFLRHYWIGFSDAPWFVRSESLVFGIGLIVLYYIIGNKLGGQMGGLCCATLIAFSNGCIIQSYIARNYIFLLFFLSLGFYCYLIWRTRRSIPALLGYGLVGCLAALTHFSAIFCIFCIAAYEALSLVRQKKLRLFMQWAVVNLFIACVAFAIYYVWRPSMAPLEPYFAIFKSPPFAYQLLHVLLFPLIASGYILPGYAFAVLLILCQIAVLHSPPSFVRNNDRLRMCLALNGFAYAVGMLLIATYLYPEAGPRHNIWVLPLVIPAAGLMLAGACTWLAEKYIRSVPVIAILLLIAGCLTYDATARFRDDEYNMPLKQWQALNVYLDRLTSSDLIVTEKDDGVMFSGLYRISGTDSTSAKEMARLVPYRNGGVVFNPYFPRYYSREMLLATLREAQAHHMLDGIRNLVFLRLAWSRSPLTDLMLCRELDKTIVTFPPLATGAPITRNGIYDSVAALMIIRKESLLNDVLPTAGKAHHCLDGKHDMVPGFDAAVSF